MEPGFPNRRLCMRHSGLTRNRDEDAEISSSVSNEWWWWPESRNCWWVMMCSEDELIQVGIMSRRVRPVPINHADLSRFMLQN